MVNFEIIQERAICYDFKPIEFDAAYLQKLGLEYPVTEKVNQELIEGTEWFKGLYSNRQLTPSNFYTVVDSDENEELEIHNYTGMCPTNVLEVSPSVGSCAVACQYCLVTDGKHVKNIEVFSNYRKKLENSLERNKERSLFYYFSPKTEAFSEPHLFNGLSHEIIRTFIAHYEKHPDSKVRIFIATKAGPRQLSIKHNGDSIFDLLATIPSKVQVNGSIGIMPQYLRDILEPNAASIKERLEALSILRESGVFAQSVLCQPLFLPYLTRETITEYMQDLSTYGVKNIKPEFFTAEIKNLVLVAQFINYYDPHKIKEFFQPYLMESNAEHIKQRSRLAPERSVCVEKLELIREIANKQGIHISICNWVKKELGGVADWVKSIDAESSANGFRCLGYQTKLF